jgi:hypothetical protein
MDSGSSCKWLGTAVCESLEAIKIAGPFVSFVRRHARHFTQAQQNSGS